MTDIPEPITYDSARETARAKAAESVYGSPLRYYLTQKLPPLIREHCPAVADVLDVGCGSGNYAYFLIEAGIEGTYLGVDIDPRQDLSVELPDKFQGKVQAMDAHKLSELDRQFDFAISITAFEHFQNDGQVSAELASVLKPGGKAVIVVPATASYLVYGKHGYRRYTENSLKKLAQAGDFETVELERIGGFFSFFFHFLWFFPAHVIRLAGKALLFAISGFNKKKAQRGFPSIFRYLDSLGSRHLKTESGKATHKKLLLKAASLDGSFPFPAVGYIVVFRKRSEKSAASD